MLALSLALASPLFYCHSIRTRIKTKMHSLRLYLLMNSIVIPLEQGLRPAASVG